MNKVHFFQKERIQKMLGIWILLLCCSGSSVAQCEVFNVQVSATGFNCPNTYGNLCFSFSGDPEQFWPTLECREYVLDVEFPEGSFVYTELGSFELISPPGSPVVLRSEFIPIYSDGIGTICIEGLVHLPGTAISYSMVHPETGHVVTQGSIVPDAEIAIGVNGSTTLLSDAIANTPLLPAGQAVSTPQSVVIYGVLVVDQNYTFGPQSFGSNKSFIRMAEGASIVVKGGNSLSLLNTDVYSCTEWDKILIEGNAQLVMDLVNIKNADVAVELLDGARFDVVRTNFDENRIGIGSFGPDYKEIDINYISGWAEQTRILNGQTGIHLENTNTLWLAYGYFFNMTDYGLYLDHTDLMMAYSSFNNCTKAGVVAQNYKKGEGLIDIFQSSVSESNIGFQIYGYQTCNIHDENVLSFCGVGIDIGTARNTVTTIEKNHISASDIGIYASCHNSTLGTIQQNTIRSKQLNVGLSGIFGQNQWSTQYNRELQIFDNTGQTTNGVNILYNNMTNGRIFKNENIATVDGQGILLNGGQFNTTGYNVMQGAAQKIEPQGIGMNSSDLSTTYCNTLGGYSNGLTISGDCGGSDIRGNGLGTSRGLLYGSSGQGFAHTGGQAYKGNGFLSSTPSSPRAFNFGSASIADQNKYIVGYLAGNQGTALYPYFVAPINNWFEKNSRDADYMCRPGVQELDNPDKRKFAIESNALVLEEVYTTYGEDIGFGLAFNQALHILAYEVESGDMRYHDFLRNPMYAEATELAEVVYDIQAASNQSYASTAAIQEWQTAIQQKVSEIHTFLPLEEDETEDMHLWYAPEYEVLQGDLDDLQRQYQPAIAEQQRILDERVGVFIEQLKTISGLRTPAAQYTRDVYLLATQSLHSDFRGYTESEQERIRHISERCAYQYETSVYLARSLRAMFDKVVHYEMPDDCGDTERGQEKNYIVENGVRPYTIYPNPVRDILTLNYPITEAGIPMSLYNTLGQRMATYMLPEGTGLYQIDMSRLPNGMYYLKDETGMLATQKVTKTR